MSGIFFLYGLGNPGSEYKGTRHNIGSETLDLLAHRRRLEWTVSKGPVAEAVLRMGPVVVRLLKPLSYMNLSGRALVNYSDIDPESLLVICDDINLPLGRIRIREGGGSGGHKGLESIILHLASEDFARLRIGIGAPPLDVDWSDYVLEPFTPDERGEVDAVIGTAADAVEKVLGEGLAAAMQVYNRRESP